MRSGARLDADQARRQLLEKRYDLPALQLPANKHLADSINTVHLKDRLSDIKTDCCDRLHTWLLRIVGASTGSTSMALACRWRSRPQHQKRTYAVQQKMSYSISSLARCRNDSGIVSPIALAVVRLMTRSNLVGCSTGISPGLAPRKILST